MAQASRKRLGKAESNEEGARKSGPARHGHSIQITRGRPGIAERILHDGNDEALMVPGRKLRDDAPVLVVQFVL